MTRFRSETAKFNREQVGGVLWGTQLMVEWISENCLSLGFFGKALLLGCIVLVMSGLRIRRTVFFLELGILRSEN